MTSVYCEECAFLLLPPEYGHSWLQQWCSGAVPQCILHALPANADSDAGRSHIERKVLYAAGLM